MRKTIILIALFLVIIPIAVLLVYMFLNKVSIFSSQEEKWFERSVKNFRESEKSKIFLKELTDFQWDRVDCIEAYSSPNLSSEELSFKLNKRKIPYYENSSFLLFLDHKNKKSYVIEDVNFYSCKSIEKGVKNVYKSYTGDIRTKLSLEEEKDHKVIFLLTAK